MNVLGIHLAHDSNVTLLEDGVIRHAIAEERINRVKMFTGFPYRSIEWALAQAHLEPAQIDVVAVSGDEDPIGDFISIVSLLYGGKKRVGTGVKLLSYLVSLCDNLLFTSFRKGLTHAMTRSILKNLGFTKAKVSFVDHHTAHAASAYYCTEWQDSRNILVCTIDGKGDCLSHTSSVIEKGALQQVSHTQDFDSMGFFYMAATEYLGFIPLRHEGKVTGLAAYGNKSDIATIPSPVIAFQDGFKNTLLGPLERMSTYWIFLKLLFSDLGLLKRLLFFSSAVRAHYAKHKLLAFFARTFKEFRREEVACFAQESLEREVVALIQRQVTALGKTKLCLAGGIFANVKLNQRLMAIKGVENIYIQPAMGDGGLSMGAALLVYSKILQEDNKELRPSYLANVYLGTGFDKKSIEAELKRFGLDYEHVPDIELRIATLLAENKIVGRFNGSMEWGPRALGNRSILAAPIDNAINDSLNKKLRRSEFMPFAPSMLAEHSHEYLVGFKDEHISARFMTVTYDVFPQMIKKIPAVVHVDGTARPQVVRQEDNPSYHRILKEYHRLTGLAAVVNTSYNMHEEPIVHTPEDAIESFLHGALDVLAIGDYLAYKKR